MIRNKLTGHAAIGENNEKFNICTAQEMNIKIKLTGQNCKQTNNTNKKRYYTTNIQTGLIQEKE